MYDGKRTTAKLRVNADLMNVVIDRFGKDVSSKAVDGGSAAGTCDCAESPVFYGWLAMLGTGVDTYPKSLREDYRVWLRTSASTPIKEKGNFGVIQRVPRKHRRTHP